MGLYEDREADPYISRIDGEWTVTLGGGERFPLSDYTEEVQYAKDGIIYTGFVNSADEFVELFADGPPGCSYNCCGKVHDVDLADLQLTVLHPTSAVEGPVLAAIEALHDNNVSAALAAVREIAELFHL